MTLVKLTEENIDLLPGKNICCVEKSVSYLNELCEKYDIFEQLSYIVDTNQRNLGRFVFRDRTLEVYSPQKLLEIDTERTAIVITSDYYKEAFVKITEVLEADHPDMNVYYFANRETEYEESYRTYYKNKPLENIIIFRSGPMHLLM